MFRNKLLEIMNPITILSRGKKTKPKGTFTGKMLRTNEGVRYPGGILYYPRPGEKDPDVAPSKLLRVERLTRLAGLPWFIKEVFYELGIGQKKKHIKENFVTVVKNIPEVNVLLWKIKHLVRITPITFPYGEPTADDVKHTKLLDSGVCLVTKEISIPEEVKEERERFSADKKRLIGEYREKDCRQKWLNPYNGGF